MGIARLEHVTGNVFRRSLDSQQDASGEMGER